jgi:hypothetical protein
MTANLYEDLSTEEADRYLLLVRAELLHLPPEDFLDFLDDVEGHVHAVAAEGGRLEERLGAPSDFVRELLASAEMANQPPRAVQRARGRLSVRPAQLDMDEWVPAQLKGLGPDLRRGWWLVRGATIPLLVFGLSFAGLVIGALGVIASVKLAKTREGILAITAGVVFSIGAAIALPFLLTPETDYRYQTQTVHLDGDGQPFQIEECDYEHGCFTTMIDQPRAPIPLLGD